MSKKHGNLPHELRRPCGKPERDQHRKEKPHRPQDLPPNRMWELVHELLIHQVELEKQNEELRKAQTELEDSRNRYSDLYDLAPVGLFSFDSSGMVLGVNLTGAEMLGLERLQLVGQGPSIFLDDDSHSLFSSHIERVQKTKSRHSRDLKLVRKNGKSFYARLDSIPVHDAGGKCSRILTSVTDITQRKIMEQELSKLAVAVIDSNDAVFIYNLEGTITSWNRSAERIYGFSEGEFLGMPITRLMPEDTSPQIGKQIAKLKEGKPSVSQKTRRLTKDGRILDVSCTISPLLNDRGKLTAIASTERDITDNLRAEEALRESENKYRMLFNGATDSLFLVGFSKNGNIEKFLDVNKVACRNLGYTREELLRMSPEDVTDPELVPGIPGIIERLLSQDNVIFETIHLTKDGRKIPMEINGHIFNLRRKPAALYIARDISERRNSEEELRKSAERFRTIFMTSPDAVTLSRLEDGHLVDVSDGFIKITGYTRDEVVGKPSADFRRWTENKDRKKLFQKLPEDGETANREGQIRRKDGSILTSSVSSKVIKLDGAPHLLSISRDITELKEAEELLRKTKDKLERKNADLEAFAYTAAHDLKTPITSAQAFLHLVHRNVSGKLSERQNSMMKQASASLDHFQKLLCDLLEFSRLGKDCGKKKKVNIKPIIKQIQAEEKEEIREKKAAIHVQPRLPDIFFHETRAYQLFANMISNSLKFNRDNVPPAIEIGVIDKTKEKIPANHKVFFLKDNGKGIDSTLKDGIFGLFIGTEKNKGGGTGIGLAIVKRIVVQEEGKIWVESTPNKGSIFFFSLPVTKKKVQSQKSKTQGHRMADSLEFRVPGQLQRSKTPDPKPKITPGLPRPVVPRNDKKGVIE